MGLAHGKGYNERLFEGNPFRRALHRGRFRWFEQILRRYGLTPQSVIELGCFDGKLLEIMKAPVRYVGLDADWEGGLSAGIERYGDRSWCEFHRSADPGILARYQDGVFDLSVCMETIEHVDPESVDVYIRELARVTSGHSLWTVPNEIGPLFLAKWIAKRVLFKDAEPYSIREIVAASTFQMNKVRRNQHKGFDYRALIGQLRRQFDIVEVEAIPVRHLPLWLSFNIGVVCRTR